MNYKPLDSARTPRFCGNRTFMRLPEKKTLENVDFVVTGVPFDTGAAFRTGQRLGPQAVREASLLLRPYNYDLELNIFEHVSGVDYGDLDIIPGFIHETYDMMVEQLKPVYEKGIIPICIGGDHAISLGELRAIKDARGPVAMIHFDSHTDTWDQYWGMKYTHGTPFRRAVEEGCLIPEKTIQVGLRGPLYTPGDIDDSRDLGFEVVTAFDIHRKGIEYTCEKIRKTVGETPVFVTFDIDFLDPAYAPGTGTPEVGGFSTWEAMELIKGSFKDLNIVGFDLVEVLPYKDLCDSTAFAASGIIFEFISQIAQNAKLKDGVNI